jgi:hypothetical protein
MSTTAQTASAALTAAVLAACSLAGCTVSPTIVMDVHRHGTEGVYINDFTLNDASPQMITVFSQSDTGSDLRVAFYLSAGTPAVDIAVGVSTNQNGNCNEIALDKNVALDVNDTSLVFTPPQPSCTPCNPPGDVCAGSGP